MQGSIEVNNTNDNDEDIQETSPYFNGGQEYVQVECDVSDLDQDNSQRNSFNASNDSIQKLLSKLVNLQEVKIKSDLEWRIKEAEWRKKEELIKNKELELAEKEFQLKLEQHQMTWEMQKQEYELKLNALKLKEDSKKREEYWKQKEESWKEKREKWTTSSLAHQQSKKEWRTEDSQWKKRMEENMSDFYKKQEEWKKYKQDYLSRDNRYKYIVEKHVQFEEAFAKEVEEKTEAWRKSEMNQWNKQEQQINQIGDLVVKSLKSHHTPDKSLSNFRVSALCPEGNSNGVSANVRPENSNHSIPNRLPSGLNQNGMPDLSTTGKMNYNEPVYNSHDRALPNYPQSYYSPHHTTHDGYNKPL